jgi:hypothetical protein
MEEFQKKSFVVNVDMLNEGLSHKFHKFHKFTINYNKVPLLF